MLNAVRTGQPVSRADLARHTGLQRSTVSLIVEQLLREGWVLETGQGRLPRGRTPTLIALNLDKTAIIGVNIQPGQTTIVLGNLNSDLRDAESFPTPRAPAALLARIERRVADLRRRHPETRFEAIGVSVPGRVDRFTEKLVIAANLGWRNVDLKTPLERATSLPVLVENAANACALDAVWTGPLAGAKDLVTVTVSEGIGTGVVINGGLVRGPRGAAGEFGHVCFDPEGPPCGCGSRGCWEVFASNNAALRYYAAAAPAPAPPARPGGRGDGAPDFPRLLDLVEAGDARAAAALDEMARWLGLGVAMIVNGLAPAAITIVGEVTRAWRRVGPVVESAVAERARTETGTRIIPANDVLRPRLRGTVAMVLQKHFRPALLS